MAAKRRNSDEAQNEQNLADDNYDSAPEDLYHSEISRYSDTIDRGLGEAFERYGFTLYHSLPPAKQLELAEKAGLLKYDAVDLYNLGGVAAERGDLAGAVSFYQKSLEQDGTFAEAAYNLAVALERLDRRPEAINAWSRFLELTQSDEDRQQVEAHLAELRG